MRCLLLMLLFSSCLQAQSFVVGDINLSGNNLTKSQVILREVPLSTGDTIDSIQIPELKAQIVQNLTNTGLFNFITITTEFSDNKLINWNIEVEERWYIWPNIIFQLAETNLNSWWQNKDFERINYGFSIAHYNFRGRLEKLTLNFQYGWKRKIGFNYQIPGLNRKRTIGAGLEVYYANNREINYGSSDNERLFYKQPRFLQEEFHTVAKIEFRPRFFNTQTIRFGYRGVWVDDTVSAFMGDYLYNDRTSSQYLLLSYGFRREMRDNRAYCLEGYLIDGVIEQEGFGLLRSNDVMLTSTKWTVNMHHRLSNRWFFGHGVKTKYTIFGTPPYYMQQGLGYGSTFIRGYELFVIDGQHYALYKSNIKYRLLEKRTIDFASIKLLEKFDKLHYSIYVNLFGDAGYVHDRINENVNPLANEVQYGYGIGVDFVTYYDLVIRFEGALNRQGTPGFYIHFKTPI